MTAPEMKRPPVAATTEGQPRLVEANGNRSFAHRGAAGKRGEGKRRTIVAFRSAEGATWRYTGKRGRVLEMLAIMPAGVTQWDTLPWRTRLSGTIHVLRQDGLVIETQREGENHHARYRLATPGSLIIHPGNTGRAA
jgi:hypothetical protein